MSDHKTKITAEDWWWITKPVVMILILGGAMIYFGSGGLEEGSIVSAEAVTVKQAACEIMSLVCAVGVAIIAALVPPYRRN